MTKNVQNFTGQFVLTYLHTSPLGAAGYAKGPYTSLPAFLKSVSEFSNDYIFHRDGTWRVRSYNSSGLSPPWLKPPRTKVPTCMASRFIKAHKPPHQVKAQQLLEIELGEAAWPSNYRKTWAPSSSPTLTVQWNCRNCNIMIPCREQCRNWSAFCQLGLIIFITVINHAM